MILGQYTSRVGAKNRIAFPKKFRDELGDTLILTYGFETSLLIVTKKNWEEFIQEWEKQSFLLPEVRDVERFLMGGAQEVILDDQGRFILPKNLKEFAQIETDVVFLGLKKYVEVWDKNRWHEYQGLLNIKIREQAKRLADSLNDKNT